MLLKCSIFCSIESVTFFAPSDTGINSLPPSVLRELTDNVTLLQHVLKFHVASTSYAASDLDNDMLIDTLESGSQIRINIYTAIDYKVGQGLPLVFLKCNLVLIRNTILLLLFCFFKSPPETNTKKKNPSKISRPKSKVFSYITCIISYTDHNIQSIQIM